jgi:hypothetical protein
MFMGNDKAGAPFIGDYYGNGASVLHFHTDEADRMKFTMINGDLFDFNAFSVTSHGMMGGPLDSQITAYDSAGRVVGSRAILAQDRWEEDPSTDKVYQLDNGFNRIAYAEITLDPNAFCFGVDDFFINEESAAVDTSGATPSAIGGGNAVPEPTALGLFALTLLGVTGRRRRKLSS